jgi:cytochrome oxidase Cu insertion factor (SCO1/SenC/PrrC family)
MRWKSCAAIGWSSKRSDAVRWKPMGLVVGGAIALLAAGGWALESWLAEPGPSQGKALLESEFSLVDHTGNPVTDEDFGGKWQLIFFGFTSCPDVCPTTLIEVSAVLEELGDDAEQITPLFISVDPERDTPEVMAEYVANFDPRIVGLTGSPEQIKQAAQAFRAYYAKVKQEDASDGYTMDHSAFLYLMDPEGEYATHFSPSDAPATVADKIRAYLTGERTV